MKNLFLSKLSFAILAVIPFVLGAVLSSCNEEDTQGAPVITKVYILDTVQRHKDSVIVGVSPGALLVVSGKNLMNIKQAFFNDFETSFNTNYNSSTDLIIRVPDNTPTEATDSTVSNKIRIITASGEATFDMPIIPPPPSIISISNENALPGSTITIYGSNFRLVEKIIFPGDIEVTDFVEAKDGKTLVVTVPNELTETDILQVVTKYGHTQTIAPINIFEDTTKVFSNFDYFNVSGTWNLHYKNSTTDYPGGHGIYAYMEKTGITANDGTWWNDDGRAIWMPENVRAELMSPDSLKNKVGDYSLKFEIFVKEPWSSGALLIGGNSQSYTARYEPWRAAGKAYQTTGWVTVTIPFIEFRTGDGDPNGQIPVLLKDVVGANGNVANVEFRFFFVNWTAGNTDIDKIAIAVDNLRVVRTAYK